MSHDSDDPQAELDVSGMTDVARFLDEVTADLREVLDGRDGAEFFEVMLIYILCASYVPDERLRQIMAKIGPDAEDVYARSVDLLRAEGEARGRVKMLVQLLIRKFGVPPVTTVLKMDAASVEQLETWTARVLSATTLDEVIPRVGEQPPVVSGSVRTVRVMSHDVGALRDALEAPGDIDPHVMEDVVEYVRKVLSDPSNYKIARGIRTHLRCINPTSGQRLRRIIAQGGPGEEDTGVTSADLLRAESEPEGWVKALKQVLSLRFGVLPADALQKLDVASVEQLAAWTERVCSATALDEVFA